MNTGLPFLVKLAAPSDYEVITPVTTLVASLTLNGMGQQEAELTVLNVLGLDSHSRFQHMTLSFKAGQTPAITKKFQ